jgi:hypothetical protein
VSFATARSDAAARAAALATAHSRCASSYMQASTNVSLLLFPFFTLSPTLFPRPRRNRRRGREPLTDSSGTAGERNVETSEGERGTGEEELLLLPTDVLVAAEAEAEAGGADEYQSGEVVGASSLKASAGVTSVEVIHSGIHVVAGGVHVMGEKELAQSAASVASTAEAFLQSSLYGSRIARGGSGRRNKRVLQAAPMFVSSTGGGSSKGDGSRRKRKKRT